MNNKCKDNPTEQQLNNKPPELKDQKDGHKLSTTSSNSKYTPPWTTPYIIGIGGPSGSGKTSIASKIVSLINVPWTVLISTDNFYKPLTDTERKKAFNNDYDFDEPDAIDLDLVYKCVCDLRSGKKCEIPVYSFVNHNRIPNKKITIYGASVIIIEGLYTLYDPRLLEIMDLKVYVDADLDICLARRLSRDIISRGRNLNGCIHQWEKFVKPNSVKYVLPTMTNANAIIPSFNDNRIAIKLLVDYITSKLKRKSMEHVQELIRLGKTEKIRSLMGHPMVYILPKTNQTEAIQTILLNKRTKLDDFIFYFDRITTILLSRALDNIPVANYKTIMTGSNCEITHCTNIDFNMICGITVIRSGDCFIKSLKMTLPNVPIGKLLIQSDSFTGEPQLHCELLPPNLNQYKKILLMEAQVINGASLIMAVQVLLDNGAKLSNIDIVVYAATETGLRRILNAFNEEIHIYVATMTSEKDLRMGHNSWCLTRFIDTKYFGSE